MNIPVFVVAGTHSGCGKTTVTLGLMAALVRRGLRVQAFKVGPDFIDPGHHRAITGRDSHNLDGWIMDRHQNREIFLRGLRDTDAAVVEGVMGLFDGFSSRDESGSTAQMAKWLDLPVVLVIDARGMARSAAAVLSGFLGFDEGLSIRGIIFNRVGGRGHGEILKDAVAAACPLPVLGCLPEERAVEIPSRHLGLVTEWDLKGMDTRGKNLARWIESNVDLNRFPAIFRTRKGPEEAALPPLCSDQEVRIGIARDEAFCFYYPENLRLLREAGARLVPFSPLRAKRLPEGIHGLILGGGYPELHCRALSENRDLLRSVHAFGMSGNPIYAECGGFMFLMREIGDLKGRNYPMAGIFSMKAGMERRLKSLGYREVLTLENHVLGPAGTRIRGHEFHYSHMEETGRDQRSIYQLTDRKTVSHHKEGFVRKNVLGSYVHLHWGSNPAVAEHFVDCCRRCGRDPERCFDG